MFDFKSNLMMKVNKSLKSIQSKTVQKVKKWFTACTVEIHEHITVFGFI